MIRTPGSGARAGTLLAVILGAAAVLATGVGVGAADDVFVTVDRHTPGW